ncbi:hypothetical protein C2G38_1950429, partial [Gigaspora rosea]
SVHYVILYKNGRHLCTCFLLVNHGLVCRHFFCALLESDFARFHIMLLPIRWCRDDITELERAQEPFLTSNRNTD